MHIILGCQFFSYVIVEHMIYFWCTFDVRHNVFACFVCVCVSTPLFDAPPLVFYLYLPLLLLLLYIHNNRYFHFSSVEHHICRPRFLKNCMHACGYSDCCTAILTHRTEQIVLHCMQSAAQICCIHLNLSVCLVSLCVAADIV